MKKCDGISLIEIIIVLLSIIVIASISIPRMNFFNRVLAKAELEKMHACSRYLQQKAIITQKDEILIFNNIQHTYRTSQKTEQLSYPIQFGVLPQTYGPPAQPKHLVNNPITFAGNQIIFFTSGTISPGTAYITDKSKSCLFALTCPVSAYSNLRMYSFDKVWKPIL